MKDGQQSRPVNYGCGRHFCGCLKYLKFGGAWSFLVGIRKPSALSM
jgi:hypothetical protein